MVVFILLSDLLQNSQGLTHNNWKCDPCQILSDIILDNLPQTNFHVWISKPRQHFSDWFFLFCFLFGFVFLLNNIFSFGINELRLIFLYFLLPYDRKVLLGKVSSNNLKILIFISHIVFIEVEQSIRVDQIFFDLSSLFLDQFLNLTVLTDIIIVFAIELKLLSIDF